MAETLDLLLRMQLSPEAKYALDRLGTIGKVGSAGLQKVEAGTKQASKAAREYGTILHTIEKVFGVFLLYKGFVLIKTQIQELVRVTVEFQHQLAIVKTQLSGLAGVNSSILSEKIIGVAQRTGIAFDELAKAEFEIVSANIAVADSYEILELAAKAAVAGGLQDAELAFNAALTQVNAFNLSTREFGDVFDKQFNLVKRGIFTYKQLGGVVGEVSIAFAGLGQDVETSNAALAAVSQIFTGSQLEEGATGLKNVALQIQQNSDRLEDFGVAVTDQNGDFRNFIEIMEDLKRSLEGLSESAQAEALKELFQEKRAIRGVSVLLKQIPELKQFYIEQKLAAGDLNDAFETVNDTIKIQAGVLKNEFIPAVEPVVGMFGTMIRTVNELNNAFPGLTRAAFQFSVAMAAITAATHTRTFGVGGPLALRNAPAELMGPAVGGGALFARGRGALTPFGMRAGLGLGLLGTIGAIQVGKSTPSEQEGTGFLSMVGGGALVGGQFGGFTGAAAGAAIGGAAFLFGQALRDEAEPTAKSFSEAFSRTLNEEATNISAAFTAGLAASGGGGSFALGAGVFGAGATTRALSFEETARRMGGPTKAGQAFAKIGLGTTDAVASAIEFFGGKPNRIRGEEAVFSGSIEDAVVGAKKAADEFDRLANSASGIIDAQELRAAREEILAKAIDKVIQADDEEASAKKSIAKILIDTELDREQTVKAVNILQNDGAQAFFDFIQEEIPKTLSSFERLRLSFNDMASGDFALAADVFAELGSAGRDLAATFARINSLMQSFQTLQTLREIKVPGMVSQQVRELVSLADAMRITGASAQPGIVPNIPGAQGFVSIPGQGMFVDLIYEKLVPGQQTLLEVLGISDDAVGQALISALKTQLSGISQGEGLTEALVKLLTQSRPDEAVSKLFGQPDQMVIPAATTLVDSLYNAADAIEAGFVEPMGFSGEQLRMLGESLQDFNKVIFKVGIIDEIGRLGAAIGLDRTALDAVIENMVQNLTIGGMAFRELFEDPSRLADLLAEVQFGDVSIDQSTRNTFTIRISGGPTDDPAALARMADALVKEINDRTRNRLA